MALIALGSIGDRDKTSSSSSTTVTVTKTVGITPTTTKPPRTTPMTTIDDDGTYLVGKDIMAGQYRSAGGSNGDRCYWERQSALGGGFSAIISNGGGEGQEVVEILPSDAAFQTKNCEAWEKIG